MQRISQAAKAMLENTILPSGWPCGMTNTAAITAIWTLTSRWTAGPRKAAS